MTDRPDRSSRRRFLRTTAAVAALGLAGCQGGSQGGNGDGAGDTDEDGSGADGDGGSTATPTPADATPTATSAADLTSWWTSHADAGRTRSTPDPVPGSLERAGTFELGTVRAVGTHPLVTPDGLFFVRDETVARYDLASRERAFERPLRAAWAFVRDGTVVVATSSNLVGLNASTGEREWIASAEFDRTFNVAPVPGGVVTVEIGGLRVLEAESGEERWTKSGLSVNGTGDVNPSAGRPSNNKMAPVVHAESGTVFVGAGPQVDALDTRSGDRRWRFARDKQFGALKAEPVPFAVRGETVYVQDRDGLLALDRADGGVRWKRTAKEGSQHPFAGKFAYAVDDTALYFWNAASEVYALSVDDGSDLWSTAFTGGVGNVSSAVAGDGVVFTTENGVRVLSKATGESRLSTDVRGAGAVVPAGGRLYVRTISEDLGRPRITVYGSS